MNRLAVGLQAALRLAIGRADGLDLLASPADQPMALAPGSFWAMAMALPGFLMLRALALEPGAFLHGLGRDLLGYVIGWVGFALMAYYLSGLLQRRALWPRYITAWNFCNVVQYMMLLVASIPTLLGWPDWTAQTCWLVAIGWSVWLEYFTTRTAMRLSLGQAIGFVAVDFLLGLVVDAVLGAFS